MRCLYYESKVFDPYENLAMEEALLESVGEDEVCLYLWQNERTVVIGRNQNPWKECRMEMLEEAGGKLARRLSGGGAVFHDSGNLNFTFVVGKKNYNLEKQLKVIVEGLKDLGIQAEFSGRNDLLVGGKKFSGNAFYFGKTMAYHHGTLMFDVDFDNLSTYLQVSKLKMQSKGIDSVRSRVANLREVNPEITLESLKEALQGAFLKVYEGDKLEPAKLAPATKQAVQDKYASWDWRFGETPKFDVGMEKKFPWGLVDFNVQLKSGMIETAKIYSDAMDVEFVQTCSDALKGIVFNRDQICRTLTGLQAQDEAQQDMQSELVAWIAESDI
jgi:lipoate-protein ligase A